MDRRSFLQVTGVAGLAAAWGTLGCAQRAITLGGAEERRGDQAPLPLANVGLQLYTVRKLMQQDVDRTLAQVAAAGYGLVETAGLHDRTPAAFRALLDRHGLRTRSGHYPFEQFDKDPQAVFAAARALGQEYVIVPSVPGPMHSSLAAFGVLADRFNRFGALARDAGLHFAYHNHNFEFETYGGSTPAYDTLLANTDPALVSFELDVYWMYKAGQEPARYFERYPGRFALWHVKDGTAPPERAMVDVGKGAIDYAGLFARARTAGLRYAIVEHDQPADPLASIRVSRDAVERLLRAG